METEYKETQRISLRKYCPSRKVPLGMKGILLEQVQREDELNHAGAVHNELPDGINDKENTKIERDIPGWINFYKNILLSNLSQLIP